MREVKVDKNMDLVWTYKKQNMLYIKKIMHLTHNHDMEFYYKTFYYQKITLNIEIVQYNK